MDYPSLVAKGMDHGAEFVNRLLQEGIPLSAAFWRQISEESGWTLFLATDLLRQIGRQPTFFKVLEIANQMPEPKLGMFEFAIVDSDDPYAQMVAEYQQQYSVQKPTWTGPRRKGSHDLFDAYFYPVPQMASTP